MNLIIILIFHYLGDFIFQTREESIQKSKYSKLLIIHSLKYSLLLYFIFYILFQSNIIYLLYIFIFHLILDFIFGKIMSKMNLYNQKQTTKFLNFMGLNQLLHTIFLILLYNGTK